jgi:hypothetical protein
VLGLVSVVGPVRGRRPAAVAGLDAAPLLGIAASESPGTVAFVHAAELIALGRVISGRGRVTHQGNFRLVEKL